MGKNLKTAEFIQAYLAPPLFTAGIWAMPRFGLADLLLLWSAVHWFGLAQRRCSIDLETFPQLGWESERWHEYSFRAGGVGIVCFITFYHVWRVTLCDGRWEHYLVTSLWLLLDGSCVLIKILWSNWPWSISTKNIFVVEKNNNWFLLWSGSRTSASDE